MVDFLLKRIHKTLILILFIYGKSLTGQTFYYGGSVGYGNTPSIGEKYVWSTWVGSNILSEKDLTPYMGVQVVRYVPGDNMFRYNIQVGLSYKGFMGYYTFGKTPSMGVSVSMGYQVLRFEYIHGDNIFMIGGGYRLW